MTGVAPLSGWCYVTRTFPPKHSLVRIYAIKQKRLLTFITQEQVVSFITAALIMDIIIIEFEIFTPLPKSPGTRERADARTHLQKALLLLMEMYFKRDSQPRTRELLAGCAPILVNRVSIFAQGSLIVFSLWELEKRNLISYARNFTSKRGKKVFWARSQFEGSF